MRFRESAAAAFFVDRMIRRNLKARFRAIWWKPPVEPLPQPCILVANHHGWHDGYVMYRVAQELELPVVDWIAEFDAFPLFASVGGMPFSPNKPEVRAATVLKTVRLLRARRKNLVLFAEGVLHRPPEILPLGGSLAFLCRKAPEVHVVPVSIRYELSMHERPECFVTFGRPIEGKSVDPELVRGRLREQLSSPSEFQLLLMQGTLDVNERWDVRKFRFPKA